jgi:hypothetical protein
MLKRLEAPAETPGQARAWDQTKNRYLTNGLCEKCAAQAAWGHSQHSGGWTPLHPPCEACAPIVATFPASTPNPLWRKTLTRGTVPLPAPQRTIHDGTGICHCGARWTGYRIAHCGGDGGCHATFTGITAFDAHRIGQHDPAGRPGHKVAPGPRRCIDPASVGLVDAGRAYPCWGWPGEPTRFWTANE